MRRRGGEEGEDEKETMIIPPPPSQCFACFRKNAGLRRTSGEGEQFKLHRMASSQFPSLLHVYVASLLLLFRKGGSGGLPTPSSPTILLPFPLSFVRQLLSLGRGDGKLQCKGAACPGGEKQI